MLAKVHYIKRLITQRIPSSSDQLSIHPTTKATTSTTMTTKTFSLDNHYYNLIKDANPKLVLGARFEPLGVDEFYWNYKTGEISRHPGSFYRRTIVSGGTELQIAELQHHEDDGDCLP